MMSQRSVVLARRRPVGDPRARRSRGRAARRRTTSKCSGAPDSSRAAIRSLTTSVCGRTARTGAAGEPGQVDAVGRRRRSAARCPRGRSPPGACADPGVCPRSATTSSVTSPNGPCRRGRAGRRRHRKRVGVLIAGGGPGTGRRDDLLQSAHVVPVLVGRHDDVEPLAALLEQRAEAVRVGRRVDEQLRPRGPAGQQVGVVVERGDAALADGHPRQLPHVGRTAGGDVTGIPVARHVQRLLSPARGSSGACPPRRRCPRG